MKLQSKPNELAAPDDARELYLTLLKHALTYYLWGETLASIESIPRISPLRKSIYWVLTMIVASAIMAFHPFG